MKSEFENTRIDDLIETRKTVRENKYWSFSDEIRNYLDTKLVFIFDSKDGQEIYFLTNGYFNKIYNYPEKDGNPPWSETQMEKIERLYKIKFESYRKFVEWNIQRDLRADKYLSAWIYSQTAD